MADEVVDVLPARGAALLGVFADAGPTRIRRAEQHSAAVVGSSPNVIRRELGDLLVKSGSLPKLSPKTAEIWTDLSPILKAFHQGQKVDPMYVSIVGEINVWLSDDDNDEWAWVDLGEGGMKYTERTLAAILGVVKGLMEANGQIDYVKEQPWFTSRDWLLTIDVNFYPNRGLSQERELAYHKDTGGDNIFVNLIFDNETDIPATEWMYDLRAPSEERQRYQQELLPKSHLEAIETTRQDLIKKKDTLPKNVSGGVAKGKLNYLSWVDDLVWHETPQMAPRAITSKGIAKSVWERLNTEKSIPMPYTVPLEVLTTTPGTALYGKFKGLPSVRRWLQDKADLQEDVEFYREKARSETLNTKEEKYLKTYGPLVDEAVKELPGARQLLWTEWSGAYEKSLDTFWRDCESVKTWPTLKGWTGEAIAKDPRLDVRLSEDEGPARSIDDVVEEPSTGRRRSNSLSVEEGGEQENVQQAFDTAKKFPRSFIRTWVRIVPRQGS